MLTRGGAARLDAVQKGTINEPLLFEQKAPRRAVGILDEPAYDRLVPGGRAVLYLVLLGTAIVIGQHIMATFDLYRFL